MQIQIYALGIQIEGRDMEGERRRILRLLGFLRAREVPVCIGTFPLAMHDCKISKYEAYATAKIYK
jgi:hypothetical protein